jgi:hypothetical protein
MAQVAQNPLLDRPDCKPLRRELLEQSLEFSAQAIRINQGGRNHVHRLRQAHCLVRMGEHHRAVVEATKLGKEKYTSGEILYGLARVCALSATAVKDSDEDTLANRYANHAMAFLLKANKTGYFKNSATAKDLAEERDLDSLENCEDFHKFLQTLGVKRKRQPE